MCEAKIKGVMGEAQQERQESKERSNKGPLKGEEAIEYAIFIPNLTLILEDHSPLSSHWLELLLPTCRFQTNKAEDMQLLPTKQIKFNERAMQQTFHYLSKLQKCLKTCVTVKAVFSVSIITSP